MGGDLNSLETFDKEWQEKNSVRFGIRSSGNKEILERMDNLGFKECLFVTNDLYSRIQTCTVGDQSIIFGELLRDHLPIIADFKDVQLQGFIKCSTRTCK